MRAGEASAGSLRRPEAQAHGLMGQTKTNLNYPNLIGKSTLERVKKAALILLTERKSRNG
jgi:hypothetical protein